MENADFHQIVAPVQRRMVNAIWRIVRDEDETEDVLQEVLANVVSKFHKVQRHPNSAALLVRMSINGAIDHVRRKRGKPVPLPVHDVQLGVESAESQARARAEMRMQVVNAMAKLPPREAEAMAMLALEEMAVSEIAASMGCAESTIRVLVGRARKRLRTSLAEKGIGPEARHE